MWYNSHIVAIIHLYGRGDPRLPALPPMANYTTCASRSWYNGHIVAIIHPVSYTHLDVYKRQPPDAHILVHGGALQRAGALQ